MDNIENTKSFKALSIKRRFFLYETFLKKIKERKKIFVKNYDKNNVKQQRKLIILEVFIEELSKRVM
jgi:hypothetical protein